MQVVFCNIIWLPAKKIQKRMTSLQTGLPTPPVAPITRILFFFDKSIVNILKN